MKIQEYFTMPKNLIAKKILGNITVYTSDNMKQKFISFIYGNKDLYYVSDSIVKLINEDKIIIAYANKSIKKLILKKLFKKIIPVFENELAFYYGFFSFADNKLVIIMEPNTKYLLFTSNKSMTITIIHELMHMAAKNIPTKFWNIFKSMIFEFESGFYADYFMINDSYDITPVIKQSYSKIFRTTDAGNNKVAQLNDILISLLNSIISHSTYDDEMVDKLAQVYAQTIRVIITNPSSFVQYSQRFISVINTLRLQYKKIFGKSVIPLPGQELIIPSEVVAVASEIDPNKSKYYKIIKLLANKV